MIYDSHGCPLKRTIGFIPEIPGYVLAVKALPIIGALNLVGFETVGKLEDEDEADAARTRKRMRRAA